jgi:hypothetical protein
MLGAEKRALRRWRRGILGDGGACRAKRSGGGKGLASGQAHHAPRNGISWPGIQPNNALEAEPLPPALRPRLLDGRIPSRTLNPKRGIFANALPFPRRVHGNARRRRVTPENQPIRQITRGAIQPLAFVIHLAANIARR